MCLNVHADLHSLSISQVESVSQPNRQHQQSSSIAYCLRIYMQPLSDSRFCVTKWKNRTFRMICCVGLTACSHSGLPEHSPYTPHCGSFSDSLCQATKWTEWRMESLAFLMPKHILKLDLAFSWLCLFFQCRVGESWHHCVYSQSLFLWSVTTDHCFECQSWNTWNQLIFSLIQARPCTKIAHIHTKLMRN